jgi:hypothetical protein
LRALLASCGFFRVALALGALAAFGLALLTTGWPVAGVGGFSCCGFGGFGGFGTSGRVAALTVFALAFALAVTAAATAVAVLAGSRACAAAALPIRLGQGRGGRLRGNRRLLHGSGGLWFGGEQTLDPAK